MQIQLALNTAEDRSLPSSAQKAVNFYAQRLPPDAKTQVEVIGTPGLSLFAGLGGASARAMKMFQGALYVVSGDTLYRVNTAGSSTIIGTLPASGEVYMADNGDQLGILVGASLYTYDGATLAIVSDGDYPGASSFDVLDGYGIFTKPNSREWVISDLNDLTAFDALDIATAESTPDNLVRVVADRELWLFKTESTEIWYNSGDADFPFTRVDGGRIGFGLAAAKAVARNDNTLAWLGHNRVLYKADGFRAVRISTHAIETAINRYETVSDAFAYSYQEEGHDFIAWTFPSGGSTFVFDASTQLIHERRTYGYSNWRPSCYAKFGEMHLYGDQFSGNIWRASLDTYTDGDLPIQRIARSAPVKVANDRIRASMSRLEVQFEMGVGLTTGQGSDPQAMMRYSDDGGKTWSRELWRSIGAIGRGRARAVWHRLGQFRHTRVIEIVVSDPVKFVISGAYAEIQGGTL